MRCVEDEDDEESKNNEMHGSNNRINNAEKRGKSCPKEKRTKEANEITIDGFNEETKVFEASQEGGNTFNASYHETLEKKTLSVEAMNEKSYQHTPCIQSELNHEENNIANLEDLSTKEKMTLIDEKCNEIIQDLLVKSKELNRFLEDACEEQDCDIMRLDI